MRTIEKWFVCKCPRDESGHVLLKEHVVLSEGFNTREMCEIEVRKYRGIYGNATCWVSARKMSVKVDPIESRAELKRLASYGESNYKEAKIWEAIAEYQRCNEW